MNPIVDAYVVTESEHDSDLLKRLLPELLMGNVHVVAGKGRYNAESLASTILAVRRVPTVLVIDADTEKESVARETESYLRSLLADAAAGVPFDITMAIPEMEVIFLQDKSILEKVAGREITSAEWLLFQNSRQALLDIVRSQQRTAVMRRIDALSPKDIDVLRTHPLIAQLSQFLSSVMTSSATNGHNPSHRTS